MKLKISYAFLALLFLVKMVAAQDMQYSQFYAAPIYLNPAFAGSNSCSRLSTNYRQQWPGVPGKFSSFVLSYDHQFPKKNSAFGMLITKDQAGTGNLGSTSGSLIYAYQLNLNRKWTLNTGFQGTFTHRSVNFYDLYFVDQLLTGSATTIETPIIEKVNYFDVSSGLVLYSRRFWAGFAAHHLNTPNQGIVNEKSPLPVKYSVHAGYQLPAGSSSEAKRDIEKTSITPTINYKHQGKFDQLDLGFYYTYQPVVLGIWYRGLPLKKYNATTPNNDALVLLVGFSYNRFTFGYSYDVTISKLAIASSRGAHETSISYQFCDLKSLKSKRKISRFVPCPKF
jgi:type IX secretion system PorP/SprF family membrane protein